MNSGFSGDKGGSPGRSGEGPGISHYSITNRIASTEASEVYLAVDTRFDRRVTLIVLRPADAFDAQTRTQLVEAAEAVSRLSHPNVLAVYEVGEADGREFIAMEYAEGLTLREMMARGALSVDGGTEVARQICAALSEIHENDLMLENLVPDNITVTRDRQIKVMCLNAVESPGRYDPRAASLPADIVAYMSPEHVEGKEIDQRSNIFSLGTILYQMITGVIPFRRGSVRDVMDAIRGKSPEPMSRYVRDVPDQLQRVVSRMLEKNAARRYQHVYEVISELRHFKMPEPVSFAPVRRKDPWNWVVLAAVAVLVAASLYGYIADYLKDRFGRTAPRASTLIIFAFKNDGPPEFNYFAESLAVSIGAMIDTGGELALYPDIVSLPLEDTSKVFAFSRSEGTDFVLMGRIGNEEAAAPSGQVLIDARVFRTGDGQLIWAELYDTGRIPPAEIRADIASIVIEVMTTAPPGGM
jgi:serine/threonine protein kinase